MVDAGTDFTRISESPEHAVSAVRARMTCITDTFAELTDLVEI